MRNTLLAYGVAFLACTVACAVSVYAARVEAVTASVAAAAAVMVLAGNRIRCPSCGYRLMWWAMRTQRAAVWLQHLFTLRACPRCRKPMLEAPRGLVQVPESDDVHPAPGPSADHGSVLVSRFTLYGLLVAWVSVVTAVAYLAQRQATIEEMRTIFQIAFAAALFGVFAALEFTRRR